MVLRREHHQNAPPLFQFRLERRQAGGAPMVGHWQISQQSVRPRHNDVREGIEIRAGWFDVAPAVTPLPRFNP